MWMTSVLYSALLVILIDCCVGARVDNCRKGNICRHWLKNIEMKRWGDMKGRRYRFTITESQTCRRCPEDWVYFDKTDSCYKRIWFADKFPYNTYEHHCTTLGGHLASIHSGAEEAFIQTIANPGGMWLGMTRDIHSRWFWTDETIVNFVEWAPGQPDDYGSSETCVYQNTEGQWEDGKCDGGKIHAGLCKKPGYTTDFL